MTSINHPAKEVIVGGSERVPYETLVLATGGTPRKLPIEGNNLSNVYTLRGVEDAKRIDAGMSRFLERLICELKECVACLQLLRKGRIWS